ncbi:MAG TPA: hypothetical protein VMY37_02415 [Thermoguttaceae bacterium]|nr:hypothetical protein [Thermoguttaceae bacterium]
MNAYILTECVVSLAILAYVYFGLVCRLRRDEFRADIRRLRDELFDYMWKAGRDFGDPSYLGTRRILNGMLRLSNRASALKFVVTLVTTALIVRDGETLCDPIPEPEDPEFREKLERVRRLALARFLRFIFLEGLTGVLVRVLAISGCAIRFVARFKERVADEARGSLLQQGYFFGDPDLPAEERASLGF